MVKNLNDYEPEVIDFVVSKAALAKFPKVIFENASSPSEVIKIMGERFVAIFPEDETATRMLDDHEIQEIREEYCLMQENEMPKRLVELATAIDQAKAMKKAAEDRLEALRQSIGDLAAQVKDGTKEYLLPPTATARIALGDYYVFYAWVNGQMQLVKAEKIPEWDKRTLWAQDDKNREQMKELFGIDIEPMDVPEDLMEEGDNEPSEADNDDF